MHLLERETHLASLTQYADDAREGSGRLVLMAGEAGVGKSSLLEQLRGRPAGRPVGVGRVRRAVHAPPAGALVGRRRHARRDARAAVRRGGGPRTGVLGTPGRARPRRRTSWSSSSRTCTGPTRRHSTCCASWAGGSATRARAGPGHLSRRRPGRRRRAAGRRRGAVHPALDPPDEPGAAVRATRWPTRPRSDVDAGTSCTGSPAATRSSSRGAVDSAIGGAPASVRDAVLARVAGLGADARRLLDVAALIGDADRARTFWSRSTDARRPESLDELVHCRRPRRRRRPAAVPARDRPAGGAGDRPSAACAPTRTGRILDVRSLRGRGRDDDARLAFHAEGAGDARCRPRVRTANAGRRAAELGVAPRGRGAVRAGAVGAADAVDAAVTVRRAVRRPGRRARPDRPLAGLRRGARAGLGPVAGDRGPRPRGRQPATTVADDVAAVPRPRGRGRIGRCAVRSSNRSGRHPSSRGRTPTSPTTGSTEASTTSHPARAVRPASWPSRSP